ncbi:MAG: hypothetical protein K8L97_25200 [Anaerolineae bacterium]|nr:hypothetical protein [Anaerolineae bacterium]
MWAVMVFVVLVVAGLVFAVLHRLSLYPGNFWEHMEWLCFGVAIGLAFASVAPDSESSKSEMIFLGGTIALFGHLCMDTISWVVMRVLGHRSINDTD